MSPIKERARLKTEVMFHGIRYSEALGRAAEHSYPNYYPYRFQQNEPNPTGESKASIPYLLTTRDGTLMRIQGNGNSPWRVEGSRDQGYRLLADTAAPAVDIEFEPLPAWMAMQTRDGFPMARAGVSLHGDMAVVNVAPGCEFFLHKQNGTSMRCTFCSYGAPDERTAHLGQVAGRVSVPEQTLTRMQEVLGAALDETEIRHIYLVGGSLVDGDQEARRFLEVARAVQEVNRRRIPVALGSAALPVNRLEQFHAEQLVDNVCFNLEVWSEPLFAKVCPGKHHFIGYEPWIDSLEAAVGIWGRERVYSAMVAGIELEPEHGLEWEEAAELAISGAEDLCRRGIVPIYSLYWPVGGRNHPDYLNRLRSFFETLNVAYYEIRRRYDLNIWEGFMCHRCAYMQLECDMDRPAAQEVPK